MRPSTTLSRLPRLTNRVGSEGLLPLFFSHQSGRVSGLETGWSKGRRALGLGIGMSKATGSPIISRHESKPFRHGHRHDAAPRRGLDDTVARARQCLLSRQKADGHWVGELQGDTILESEYILLMAFLGRAHDEEAIKAARYILTQELPGGAWSSYPGGPADVSVSV